MPDLQPYTTFMLLMAFFASLGLGTALGVAIVMLHSLHQNSAKAAAMQDQMSESIGAFAQAAAAYIKTMKRLEQEAKAAYFQGASDILKRRRQEDDDADRDNITWSPDWREADKE